VYFIDVGGKIVPDRVVLYSSTLSESFQVFQQVDVQQDTFDNAHKMRELHAAIQSSMLHPALREWDRKAARGAQAKFERERRNLVYTSNDAAREEISKSVHNDLRHAKDLIDNLIDKYKFIRDIMEKKYELKVDTPRGSGKRLRIRCGLIKDPSGKNPILLQRAYEADWMTPTYKPSSLFDSGVSINFGTKNDKNSVRPYEESDSEESPTVIKSFDYYAKANSLYVIGWKLSCDWEGQKEPKVVVDQPNYGILSSRLSIHLTRSQRASWRCMVTYVRQDDYYFPDLNLEEMF
jgi:hypothetical protein